jgi:MFS family permease
MMNSTPLANHGAGDPTAMTGPGRRLLLSLMAICFLAHFNRISMSVAGDLRLMEQYQISPTKMGTVYSAFLVTYTLFMIPAGWLIDRRGVRFSLEVVCFGSAIFVLLTGCVSLVAESSAVAFGALVVIRALMGITSAPLHPAAAKAVSVGIPVLRRSAANGLVTAAALLGVTATFVVFGALIDWLDWPAAFVVAALATAAIGALWRRWAIDEPLALVPPHPRFEERDRPILLRSLRATETVPGGERGCRSFVRRNKNLLLLTGSYGAAGYIQYLFFYWMHYYFENILGLDAQQSRFYSAAATLAMALGMALGGWLSDRLESLFGWRVARAGLAISAMTASSGLVLLGITSTEPLWTVTWLALAMGVLGLAEGPFWVTAVEVGGQRGGLSASILNTGGNVGGILAPVITPWLSDTLELGWQVGIAAGSGVCLLGAALWCGIDLTPPAPRTGQQPDEIR